MPQARDEAGNVWEVDAQGNPVRLIQAAGGQGRIIPKETDPYEQPQAEADLNRTRASTTKTQVDASVAQATAPASIQKAEADARKAAAEAEKIESGRDMLSATERANALTGYQSALALTNIIADLEAKYREGPGSTSGVMGVADYLPTEANQRFDKAANAARGIVGQALGFTGGQLNSAEEAKLNIGPYIPDSTDKDGSIEDAIERLRELQRQAMQRSISILGGVPDENGNITPLSEENRPNALTYTRTDGGVNNTRQEAAGFGATEKSVAYPEEGQARHDALVASLIASNGGRLDPQAYARARAELDREYGMQGDAASYEAWAGTINEYLDNGGATIPTGISPSNQDMTTGEIIGNSIASNPLSAAASGYFDTATFGASSALAGREKFEALQEKRPISTIAGQIGGALTGTGAIGFAGRNTIGRAAPKLMGGSGKAQFGRNLATDVGYGTAYGTIAEGDPVTGAVSAGIGSAIGQPVASAIGRGVGGIDFEKATNAIRQRGIPVTTGQMMGGTAKAIEDRMTSMPIVGDLIGKRRMEGLQAFNREAMREASAPIGFNPSQIGREGIEDMQQAVGKAYDDATAGADVGFDGQFVDDLTQFNDAAQRLPRDFRVKAARAVENRIAPLTERGSMSGEQYQQAVRGLKGYKAETSKPGFEQDYRDALTLAQDALTAQMQRGGGREVVEGLSSADQAYRGIKTVEDAAMRADGADYVFTPSQLQDALKKTGRKYPGKSPLTQLADDGQAALPSRIPDSGTAGRFAQMTVPGVAVGSGAGAGYALDGQDGAMAGGATSAALTALLVLGGTKNGQRALNKMLFDRPEKAKEIGRAIRKRKGLFGSAAVPVAIGSSNQ